MKLQNPIEIIGTWTFVIAFAIALILGLFNKLATESNSLLWFLLIAGTIVGFLNITSDETEHFLIAGVALMLTGTVINFIPLDWLKNSISNIVIFVIPAVIIAAVKSVIALAAKK